MSPHTTGARSVQEERNEKEHEQTIMAARKRRSKRDIEKDYSPKQFVAKLRRLADCIEQAERFRIQVAGQRVSVPASATINIEHERGDDEEELEFQLKWPLED